MKYIDPPFKYNGKKYDLLEQLNKFFPNHVDTFFDLFGGSGVVSLNCHYDKVIYNDINEHTTKLFFYVSNRDITTITQDIKNIFQKYKLENKEHFNNLRNAYNNDPTPDKLLVLSYISFNNTMRFNKQGKYNSTYGERHLTLKQYENIVEFKNNLSQYIYIYIIWTINNY